MLRRSPIWSDPRVKPPFGSVELDRGHPLASLAGCWLFNEGAGASAIDLARRDGPLTLVGDGWAPSAKGIGFTIADQVTAKYGRTIGTSFYGNTTVFAGFSRNVIGNTNTIFARHTTDGVGSDYWARLNMSTHILEVDIPWVVGQVVVGTFAFSSLGVPYTCAMTRSGSTGNWDWAMYGNGVVGGTTTGSTSNPATGTEDFWAQNRQTNLNTINGELNSHFLYRYARALLAGEILWLHAEPFIAFRPIIRRRYFVPAAGVTIPRFMYDYRRRRAA